MINWVLGPISPDKLGITLVHEHFTFAYPGWFADATIAPEDYKAALKTNIGVIKAAQKVGIKTIIDATPNDTAALSHSQYLKRECRFLSQPLILHGKLTGGQSSPPITHYLPDSQGYDALSFKLIPVGS